MVADPGWLAIARTPRATILARLRRARGQPEGWQTRTPSSHVSGVQEGQPGGLAGD